MYINIYKKNKLKLKFHNLHLIYILILMCKISPFKVNIEYCLG